MPTLGVWLLAIGAGWLAGCRTLESPSELTAALATTDTVTLRSLEAPRSAPPLLSEPSPPLELADDGWAAVVPVAESGVPPAFRWQHAGLAKLLSLPAEERPPLEEYLTSDDPVAVANAAIMLARGGDDAVDRCLVEAIRDTNLKLPQRRAAVEALAGQESAIAGPALAELLDDLGDAEGKRYSPELHAELLRGLARHVDAATSPTFAAGLQAKSPDVRQAALYAYTISLNGVLPQEAVELRKDTNPRVRSAALACLAARQHPQALTFAEAALADFHLDVRLAAVRALGEIGGQQARTDLQRLLIHEPEGVRSGAVLALAISGDDVTVFSSANDPSWQVRRSVAQSLTYFPTPRGATIARQLLADRSAEVRRAVIDSLENWPLPQSGTILLTAMADAPFPTRKQAADQLARRWAPAAQFNSDAPAEQRSEQVTVLKAAWQQAYAGAAPAPTDTAPIAGLPFEMQSTTTESPSAAIATTATTPLAAHHEVLDKPSATSALLDELVSEDVNQRREAAKRLAAASAEKPLDEFVVAQLADFAMAETDSLVWRDLLQAIKADTSAPAVRMAHVGTSHTAADVRRLSCGYLALHPDPAHATVLLRLLDDPNNAVAHASIAALSHPGVVTDPMPLERLLASDDGSLRVAAARCLAVNGFPTGTATLQRLSVDPDPELRRQAVTAMGPLRDAAFVETLIGRLDDDLSIRLASIVSLSQIVGRDVNLHDDLTPPPLADQVAGWKRWWDEQPQRAASLPPAGQSKR